MCTCCLLHNRVHYPTDQVPVKYKLPVHMESCLVALHTAEEPSPHQLRRTNTIDRPIGVQHQPVGMMTELAQKLEEREEENNDRD